MSGASSGAASLTKVVTRHGDDGYSQHGGSRVLKCDPRIEAYGTVDEANSIIGLLRTELRDEPHVDGWLRAIQSDLMDIGADLSRPGETGATLRLGHGPTERVEGQLDELNAAQPQLTGFVLPTGARAAAARAHLARSVVRRAERRVVALTQIPDETVNPEIQRYLNRLSDFLFVLARHLNDNGAQDELWTPPGRR